MSNERTPHPTLLCRAHLHHKWVVAYTPDGERYMRCKNCGTDRTELDSDNVGGKNLGAGLAGFAWFAGG
jgi:hypothetical protein